MKYAVSYSSISPYSCLSLSLSPSLSHSHLQFKVRYQQQLHRNCQPSPSLNSFLPYYSYVCPSLCPSLPLLSLSSTTGGPSNVPCTHSFLYMTLNFKNNTTSLNFAIFSSNKLKDSTLVNVSEHFHPQKLLLLNITCNAHLPSLKYCHLLMLP